VFQHASSQGETGRQDAVFQRLQISFSSRLELINHLEHRLFRLVQQGYFELVVRFHGEGFLSVLSFSFTDEYIPFSLACLQLFHTPQEGHNEKEEAPSPAHLRVWQLDHDGVALD
jgi:hypothetical protein